MEIRPKIKLKSGRNLELGAETAENYAKTRPEPRLERRSGREIYKNPAEILH